MATLRNGRTGAWLATDLHLATSTWAKTKGLLGQHGLPSGEGLYLDHCQSIHSFFMQFPFDAVFIDGGWKVLHLIHAMPANRISRHLWRARGVVELPAGVVEATQTAVGDVLEFSAP